MSTTNVARLMKAKATCSKHGAREIASTLEGSEVAVYGTVEDFVRENGEYMTPECWIALAGVACGFFTSAEVGPFHVWA